MQCSWDPGLAVSVQLANWSTSHLDTHKHTHSFTPQKHSSLPCGSPPRSPSLSWPQTPGPGSFPPFSYPPASSEGPHSRSQGFPLVHFQDSGLEIGRRLPEGSHKAGKGRHRALVWFLRWLHPGICHFPTLPCPSISSLHTQILWFLPIIDGFTKAFPDIKLRTYSWARKSGSSSSGPAKAPQGSSPSQSGMAHHASLLRLLKPQDS